MMRCSSFVARVALLWLLCLETALAQAPAKAEEPAQVMLREAPVFTIATGDGTRSARERARAASTALATAAEASSPDAVRFSRKDGVATLMAGTIPIIELTVRDAELAGDSSLDVHAQRVASLVKDGLRKEQRRSEVAGSVFSVSLVVFFGLVTLYLLRKLQEFAGRGRDFVLRHPERIPALHVSSLEVLGSGTLRSLLVVGLGVGRFLGLLGLVYAWLLVSLSLFEETKPYTEKLTGFVITPLSSLVGRLASSLPLMVIALVAASAVLVLLRLTSLFFASVARGETPLSWLTRDHAPAASWLVRVAIVLCALVFAAPLLFGDREGALARIGFVALASFALACAPLLASVVVGIAVIFSRAVSIGDRAVYGGERGHVRAIGLLALTLDAEDGSTVQVPHLRALWHPTRLLPRDGP